MICEKRLLQRLGGTLAACGLLAALSGCGRAELATPAESAPASQPAPTAAAQTDSTPLPTIVVEGEAAQPIPTLDLPIEPTTVIPARPDLAPIPAAVGQVQLSADFAASGDLSNWSFADIKQDAAGAPEWSVRDGLLVSPVNVTSAEFGNDLLALTGPVQSANYRFEATSLAGASSIIGLVVGYSDPNNYVAVTLAKEDALNGQGLQLVQRVNGETKVLQSVSQLLAGNRWYTFAVEVAGNQVTVQLNGQPVLSGTATGTLGQQVGLYGGAEGGAFYGDARLVLTSQ